MTNRTFVVPLLAALLAVLTLASSAWAACAWVLWTTTTVRSINYEETLPMDSFVTKDECDLAYMRASAKAKKDKQSAPERDWFFVCLPDTVDPRGPKASGR
jgi:hypothetical protein